MAKDNNDELEGITLDVYLHVLKKGKPVGPREVMKEANLSSPSVAYRHLQRLEDLGYLQKNEYGEYVTKNKAHVSGYVWIGNRLMPKMWRYSIIFLAILALEAIVLYIHYEVETYEFKVFFLLLILITGFALAVFTVEGLLQIRQRRIRYKHPKISLGNDHDSKTEKEDRDGATARLLLQPFAI
ncbi:MAG: hypothetical protein ABSG33_08330 [Candidatus Bathyarchaeia archaeon]|jgi:hypothetical protein